MVTVAGSKLERLLCASEYGEPYSQRRPRFSVRLGLPSSRPAHTRCPSTAAGARGSKSQARSCWSCRRGSRPSTCRPPPSGCCRPVPARCRAGAVALAVGERTIERVRVLHLHPDVLVLVAELQRVFPFDPREVHLGIEQGRILPLRIGALPAEGGESARDARRRQAAGHVGIGGQAGNHDRVVADRERVFAGARCRQSQCARRALC